MYRRCSAALAYADKAAYCAILWALLLASFACFTLVTYGRPTDWYKTNQAIKDGAVVLNIPFPGNVPVLSAVVVKNGKNTTVLLGSDVALMSGSTTLPIVLQWGSVMMAALCTAGLVPVWRKAATRTPTRPTNAVHQAWCALLLQLRRVATYPLPPRHFWAWFCGGLNPLELLFFGSWVGLAVTYLCFNINKSFVNIGPALTPPSSSASAALVPPSTSATTTGVPASVALPALFLARRFTGAAKAFGETLRVLMMVMFFPVSRSSFLKWLLGTDFSYLIKFHRWMSWGTLLIATMHGLLQLIDFGCMGELDYQMSWTNNPRNVCGMIALIAGLIIGFTSCAWFRATYYRVFINVHIIGFVVFVLFSLMHYKNLVTWIMAPFILYGMDRAFRLWQLSNWCRVPPCDLHVDGSVLTLRLTWAAGSRVRPGQTVYLRAPGVSWLQSHPFSVSHAEGAEGSDQACAVTVHIKVAGAWTRGLRRLALSGCPVLVQVEGPYDTSLETPPQGPVVVMVAGGMGVTPLLGLLRHYLSHPLLRPRAAYLLWSSRALCELRLLGADLLAAAAQDQDTNPNPVLHITVANASNDTPVDANGLSTSPPAAGWLHPTLHYTGCDADLAASTPLLDPSGKLRVSESSSAGAPSSESRGTLDSHKASLPRTPSAAHARPLQEDASMPAQLPVATKPDDSTLPRHLSTHPTAQPWVYAVCVLLAMFGCYAALIAAAYVEGYAARTTVQGMYYPTIGVMQFFLLIVGIVLPPLTFLASLPIFAWAACLLGITRPRNQPPAAPDGVAGTGTDQQPHAAMYGSGLVFGPGLRLMAADSYLALGLGKDGAVSAGAQESSSGLTVVRGRPNAVALLRRVKQAHMGACAEIEVLVGGPLPMWEAVVEACIQVGAEPGPALRPRKVAHQH